MTAVQAIPPQPSVIPLDVDPDEHLRQVSYALFRKQSHPDAQSLDEFANNFKNWALDNGLSISENPNFGDRRHEIVAESQHARFLIYILGDDRVELNAFGKTSVICSLSVSLAPIFQAAMVLQDGRPAFSTPIKVCGRQGVQSLIELLISPKRRKPVIVVTEDLAGVVVDMRGLASATFGVAHVVFLPQQEALYLTEAVTKVWSVFRGAVRIYWPGLDFSTDNPLNHKLTITPKIRAWKGGPIGFRNSTIMMMHAASLRLAPKERHDRILSRMALIKPAHVERRRLTPSPADVVISRKRSIIVPSAPKLATPAILAPITIDTVLTRARQLFAKKILIPPRALRDAKGSPFQDLDLVEKSLKLLATSYRMMRLKGGKDHIDAFQGGLNDLGISNRPTAKAQSLAGNPAFRIDLANREFLLDWHLKRPGNTRDPKRCFRIYYCWDAEAHRVIVGSLPGHLSTAVT